ncbi:hypothetical protein DMC30DRAFT_388168 [Rhodotorula diobovata]|uniref:Uncharacterized protein n=1 Tax=Rhodotorula diobovata TaxID=5288 RepID=A0A5C5G634_9BASI|nr:hypothetical protein DMC30DRAFT_388168 [Rhodotorula diobovata]
MRTSYALIAVALSAVGAVATSNHAGQAPRHLRQKRAWGHRRAESVASPTVSAESPSETFLSAVPEVVPASVTVTISNTEAQSPQTTAQAVGATQAAVAPLTCAPSVGLHGSCDPNAGACCQSGLTCSGQVCEALCTIDTLEPYCDAALPCNEALGYTCYKNRCRPPSGAIRVQLEEPCDQGSGNTRFCIPGKGICVGGTCLSCSQHA